MDKQITVTFSRKQAEILIEKCNGYISSLDWLRWVDGCKAEKEAFKELKAIVNALNAELNG